MMEIWCKGLGMALDETNVNCEYGSQSNNPTLDTLQEIVQDVLDNYTEKSFGAGGAATGYTVTGGNVENLDAALSIAFVNAPYQTCKQIINKICLINTAYNNGTTAGSHWIVDVSGNMRLKRIGVTQVGWTLYYKNSQVDSTLQEGVDFHNYVLQNKTEDFANKVVLCATFRKPPYDFWCEGQAANWGNDGITNINNNAVTYVVGTQSLEFDMDSPPGGGTAYWPATEDAAWDFTKIGSEENPPTLNFYFYKDANCNEPACDIRLFTTDHDEDYFRIVLGTWTSDPNGEWIHRSIPVGPYWKTKDESRLFRWVKMTGEPPGVGGNAVWSSINGIAFRVTADPATDTELLYDDLHFAGKIIREAKDQTHIGANTEYQVIVNSRAALDDSLDDTDDTGMAGYYALAELLKRMKKPYVLTFTTAMKEDMLAGQYVHTHAQKNVGDSFNIDTDLRVLEIVHNINVTSGYTSTVTLTNDLINSFPATGVLAREVMNEFLLVNNKEAKDMRGGDVDLLIPHLVKDYNLGW